MIGTQVPALALAASLVPALVAQDPEPRRTLRAETIAQVREVCGHEPFAMFAAWTHDDLADGMERFFEDRPDALRAAFHEAAVCGLWSDDADVAFGAACHVKERMLDVADIDRYVAITMPHLFDEELRFDWDTFKHVLSTEQVGRVIGGGPAAASDTRSFFLNDLHRSMRAEHIPALALRVRDGDPIVREGAFNTLCYLAMYNDRHRENIALELLAWPGDTAFLVVDYDDASTNPVYEPRVFELGPETAGYSPILRAVLRRWLVELDRQPTGENVGTWLARWARDESPGPDDRGLLFELLGSPFRSAHWIALRGLRQFAGDAEVRAALAEFEENRARLGTEFAAAAAARGDFEKLRERAIDDSAALLAVLEAADEPGWRQWCERALGAEAGAGLEALEILADARDDAEIGPLLFPERVDAELRAAVDASAASLDAERLAFLVTAFPSCRSPALAEACLAQIGHDHLSDEVAAFLELHDEGRLRERLVGWVRSDEPDARDRGLQLLAQLGAPDLAEELVAWAGDDLESLYLLARSGTAPAARAPLVEEVRAIDPAANFVDWTPVGALAAAFGIPELACETWAEELDQAPRAIVRARWDGWVRRLVEGDAIGVLVDSFDVTFGVDSRCDGLGLVDDERVREHLRRLRDRPGANLQDVIGELAIAGDPAAVAEMEEVRSRHLYGWIDGGGLFLRTLGPRLDLVPYWIAELGTVCCRRNGAAWAIEGLTGFDAGAIAESGPMTQREHAELWWRRVGAHLRWSRIAGRFAVAPH